MGCSAVKKDYDLHNKGLRFKSHGTVVVCGGKTPTVNCLGQILMIS